MKTKMILSAMALFPLFAGCGSNTVDEPVPVSTEVPAAPLTEHADTNVIKVYVDHLGTVSADGETVSLDQLDKKLATLAGKKGTVYYSRENANEEPHEQALKVIDAIAKYGLPVQFYTDNTFTQMQGF